MVQDDFEERMKAVGQLRTTTTRIHSAVASARRAFALASILSFRAASLPVKCEGMRLIGVGAILFAIADKRP